MKKIVFGTLLTMLVGGAFFSYKIEAIDTANKKSLPEVAKVVSLLGAGTAWASHGFLITAAHVCASPDNSSLHLLINGEAEETHILYFDSIADLCVLAPTIDMPREYDISSKIPTGTVTIVGMPGFAEKIEHTIIEQTRKTDTIALVPIRLSEKDVLVLYSREFHLVKGEAKPGMSGGPAFDKTHKVIGLLTGGGEDHVLLADVRKLIPILENLK